MSVSTPPPEAADDSPVGPGRAKRVLRFCLIQSIVVVVLVLGAEFLFTAWGVSKLETKHEKPPSTYPTSPDDYVKVAIFGGSAAAGTYSARGVSELLEEALRRRFPERRVYVKNYASHGEPFHRHQAEYVKKLIHRYDFVLIYCGNNEAENWYDDSGYWRKAEFQDAKDLVFSPPPDAMARPWVGHVRRWLADHSRSFAWVARLRQGRQPPVAKNRNRNYSEFEDEPSVPENELVAIDANFEQDLRDIGALADQHGVKVLVSTAATFETWPPSYSTFSIASPDVRVQWQAHYTQGLAEMQNAAYGEAITSFEEAARIDPEVAVLNYRLGICQLRQGRQEQGRRFLRRAVDREGHYFRPHSSFHAVAKRLTTELPSLEYVDMVRAFHDVMAKGEIQDEDLFTDVCHPSFLGYVIMAETFLQHLVKHPPLRDVPVPVASPLPVDWRRLAEERYRDLNIQPQEVKVAVAGNILYCFDLMHFCAYPSRCREQIEQLMDRMVAFGADDPMVTAFNAVCRARFAVRDLDVTAGVAELNRALEASPDELDKILDLKAWNHYIEDEFTEVGIEYSRDVGRFVPRGVPVLP